MSARIDQHERAADRARHEEAVVLLATQNRGKCQPELLGLKFRKEACCLYSHGRVKNASQGTPYLYWMSDPYCVKPMAANGYPT